MFSLTLLLILSVALSGCSIVGSRISHALGDEENYIMNEEIITTAPAEEDGANKFFESFLTMLKGIIRTILPIIGLGYFVKYFE